MTRQSVIARNRANALKSTGPKTSRGKLVVSGNALRHGATARPDPEEVATWLRIILDQPSLGLEGLLLGDNQIGGALALAEAEARLSACEDALKFFESGAKESVDILPDMLRRSMPVIAGLKMSLPTGSKTRGGHTILERMLMRDIDGLIFGGTRHRLLLRYRDEARSHRRRKFQEWIAILEGQNMPLSRNKAKNLP